ncbi:MAG: hypothetical protein ABIQ03_09580 [Burkholderiales bacterium]
MTLLAAELADMNILVNSICPGWVKSDMGGPDAPRTVEQGADTVWLATLEERWPAQWILSRQTTDCVVM